MNTLNQIHQCKDAIASLAQRYGAERVRIFGSVARGKDRPDSDIDVLVTLPHGYDLFTQRLALAQGLQALLHREIDLIPEHELNPDMREQVLTEAVEL